MKLQLVHCHQILHYQQHPVSSPQVTDGVASSSAGVLLPSLVVSGSTGSAGVVCSLAGSLAGSLADSVGSAEVICSLASSLVGSLAADGCSSSQSTFSWSLVVVGISVIVAGVGSTEAADDCSSSLPFSVLSSTRNYHLINTFY